jgi:cytoskeleton protein RodZ
MFEIGNTLREARLRRGLDILQCEAETKIRAKYLRAMEEEHFDLMPSPTYVRGFLRTYADFLDLDGQLVLDEYESRFGIYEIGPAPDTEPWRKGALRPAGPRGNGNDRRAPGTARTRRAPRRRRTELRLLWLAIGGVMGVALLVWMGVGGPSEDFGPVPGAAGTAISTNGTSVPAATVDDPDTSLQEAPARKAASLIVLEGVGDIGSWVAVRSRDAEGRLVWEDVLGPGQTREFRIRESIHITTGNPTGLLVTVDGDSVPLEGATGRWVLSASGAESAD